jgi:protein TonB
LSGRFNLKWKPPAIRMPLPEWFLRLDRGSRIFTLALLVSLLLHAVLLSIHFRFPDPSRKTSANQLEVVFVNSKTKSRPTRPDVLAQANLDGGGNTDENRRAKTPLPVLRNTESGNDLKQATRRMQELEARQQQLLRQAEPKPNPVPDRPNAVPEPQPEPVPAVAGRDLAHSALAIARLEAQVARSLEEYNKRPRKTFVGARAAEYRFAQYVDGWRQKIERIGNLNYPEGARGRIYGSLRLSVYVNSDGSLAKLELERSSGHPVLDRAAERIVQMSAPYARFPDDIRKDTDILVITRTWHFAPGDKLSSD